MAVIHPIAPPVGKTVGSEFDDLLSFKEILALLQRYRKLILICMAAGGMMGIAYILFTVPRYTAAVSIFIDPRQKSAMPEALDDGRYQENLTIDSQIEILNSTKLLEKAAQKAGVFDKIEVAKDGMLTTVKKALFGADPEKEKFALERARQQRLYGFISGLNVSRVRNTYVISVKYTSSNPEHSTKIANLIANVYLDDELEAKYEASQRTSDWLKERLAKLRAELSGSEETVEGYKEKNDIIQLDNRTVISDQQLSDLNSSLAAARAESAQARARYGRIQSIIQEGNPNTATSDLLSNRVVSDLYSKYLELSRHSAELLRKQGSEHETYRSVQRQMADIQRMILNEYQRVAESYKNEFEIAQSKEKALQEELNAVKTVSMASNRNQIELRELQRQAESTRTLYTKMLDNFNEQVERQSIPIVSARIISPANIPMAPSWPNKRLIMMASLLLGFGAGIALAFIREQFEKFIWKAEELEVATNRTCLGMLPKITFDNEKLNNLSKRFSAQDMANQELTGHFNSTGFQEITQLLDKQTSITTEIMRNVQLAIQFNKDQHKKGKAKVISFVSARPGEGKSITSCFLAKHLAKTGAKVAIVDCDFRRPSLTRWFFPDAKTGFYELASRIGLESEEKIASDIVSICHKTGDEKLYFIPAKGANTAANLNLVSSGQMNTLISHLQRIFDVVLIDLPPIVNIVDARVIADSIDAFIILAHWGKTDREVVSNALARAPEVYEKTVGSLLTLVDTEKASRYGYYNYNYYYYYNR